MAALATSGGGVGNEACFTRLQKEYTHLLRDPVPGVLAHPSPSTLLEWHYVICFEKREDGGTREDRARATDACSGSSSGSGSGSGRDAASSKNTVTGVSDYAGGTYYGKIVFPTAYPYAPPSILMMTPSGRFSTNTRLCLSMSDYHPESWNPMWSVASILQGLLSVSTSVLRAANAVGGWDWSYRVLLSFASQTQILRPRAKYLFQRTPLHNCYPQFMCEEGHTAGSVVASSAERRLLAGMSMEFNRKIPMFNKLFPEIVEEYLQEQRDKYHQERMPLDGGGMRRRGHRRVGSDDDGAQAFEADDESYSDISDDDDDDDDDDDFIYRGYDRYDCVWMQYDPAYKRRRSAFADTGAFINVALMCFCIALLSLPLYNLA